MNPPALESARSALMLMDFQNDVVDRVEHADALLDRVAGVRAVCGESGVRSIYIRVAFDDFDPLVHEVLTERVFPRQADIVRAADVANLFAGSATG